MAYVVGCVPYMNAAPLVAEFERQGADSPVRVVYDVPSRLPTRLEAGEVGAILVSSIDALRIEGRRMVDRVCIGSRGAVRSVRLFSKVAPEQIRSLALDESSLTSNRLAQIVLAERFNTNPAVHVRTPHLEAMLADHDAAVLIGDLGMTADGTGLHVLDLGEEWLRLTGMPFVWAAWVGNEELSPELASLLRGAAVSALDPRNHDWLVRYAHQRWGWAEPTIRSYLFETMDYDMDPELIEGLRAFQKKNLALGFDDCRFFPQIVPSAPLERAL